MNNKEIYSLWVDGDIQDLNKLAIRSVQNFGHKLIIYSYVNIPNAECEVRDAKEILPATEIYYYAHFPYAFRLGGFAERLKSEMLYKLGGVHVDLDVVFLKEFDYKAPYVFRPHPQGVVGNIIKAPAQCQLADAYRDWTSKITKDNRDWERSFKGLNTFVKGLGLRQYIVNKEELGDDTDQYWKVFLESDAIPSENLKAIHFCGAMELYKNYKQGSFYESLLKKYRLL